MCVARTNNPARRDWYIFRARELYRRTHIQEELRDRIAEVHNRGDAKERASGIMSL
jgi:hypothetical protein